MTSNSKMPMTCSKIYGKLEVLSNPYSYGDEGELVCVTIYDGEEVVFQRELD